MFLKQAASIGQPAFINKNLKHSRVNVFLARCDFFFNLHIKKTNAMKKRIFTLLAGLLFSFSSGVYAQSFTIDDTVHSTPIGYTTVLDVISNTTASTLKVQWKVIASNFPTDWNPLFSLCDNMTCISNGGATANNLWPMGLSYTSADISASSIGDFHMIIDLTTATTTGTYYLTVRLNNSTTTSDTALTTFVINKPSTTATPVIKHTEEVVLYPNPARDEINVIYDASADVKNIAVYNLIGKVMAVYKVTENNSANLNLENLPSGIYFARLLNSQGNVVVTRKFTKQ